MGALSASEAGRAALPQLDRYAAAVGLAFQVQDDILDVVGETEKIGKRQGRTNNTEEYLPGVARA